jgi:spore coat protein U-like protein
MILLAAPLIATLAASTGQARTLPGTVNCSVTASPLTFGTYHGRAQQPQDIMATVSVSCFARGMLATPVAVAVTPVDGGTTNRQMQGKGAGMRYQLFVDPARTLAWGDGAAGTSPLKGSGAVAPGVPLRLQFRLYGRVLARQAVRSGAYVDNVPIHLGW